MKFSFILFATAVAIALQGEVNTPEMVLYYVPFEIETLVGVRKSNIKERAHFKIHLTNGDQLSQIRKLLREGRAGHFVDGRVRLLVEDGSQNILVDAEGCCLIGTNQVALSTNNFAELRKLVTALSLSPLSPAKP